MVEKNANGLNGLAGKKQRTADKIIKALFETKGLQTLAAGKAGVSYTTVKRYVHDVPSVRQAADDAKEQMVDFAESKLHEKIAKGDIVAILFYLKTQAKHRGYIERSEVSGSDGKPITIKVVYE